MKELIDVFRMTEISVAVRCKLIVEIGSLINAQYGSNVTESLVLELVRTLDPNHPVCSDPHYLLTSGEINTEEWCRRTNIVL